MLNQEQIDFLNDNQSWSPFFLSLLNQFQTKGSLSPGQISCINAGIAKSKAAPPAPSITAGEQIEIKGWIANQLKKQLNLDCFFRNLEVTEVVSETKRAVSCKVKFVSKIASSCHCCGRELDTEVSRVTGIGPVCATRLGLPRPTLETANEVLAALDTLRDKVGEIGPIWIPKSQIIKKALAVAA